MTAPQPIAYDPDKHDPPPNFDIHHVALQVIDRVVGNELTLDEEDTAWLRRIVFAALAVHPQPPAEEVRP
ncbi:hypothetical protein AB0B63_06810 [Micromonospora sp. NPDC049081]|uniref:hypothetical protein n=1 Tax=Micromonospora sp. NPDC049081 TaxID=3155150 RepID=UPI0033CA155B